MRIAALFLAAFWFHSVASGGVVFDDARLDCFRKLVARKQGGSSPSIPDDLNRRRAEWAVEFLWARYVDRTLMAHLEFFTNLREKAEGPRDEANEAFGNFFARLTNPANSAEVPPAQRRFITPYFTDFTLEPYDLIRMIRLLAEGVTLARFRQFALYGFIRLNSPSEISSLFSDQSDDAKKIIAVNLAGMMAQEWGAPLHEELVTEPVNLARYDRLLARMPRDARVEYLPSVSRWGVQPSPVAFPMFDPVRTEAVLADLEQVASERGLKTRGRTVDRETGEERAVYRVSPAGVREIVADVARFFRQFEIPSSSLLEFFLSDADQLSMTMMRRRP